MLTWSYGAFLIRIVRHVEVGREAIEDLKCTTLDQLLYNVFRKLTWPWSVRSVFRVKTPAFLSGKSIRSKFKTVCPRFRSSGIA